MTPPRSVLLLGLLAGLAAPPEGDPGDGLKTIAADEVVAHLAYLASPTLEGRDSPSRGLMLAAEHVAGVFAAAGLEAAPDSLAAWQRVSGELPGLEGQHAPPAWSVPQGSSGTYLRPFEVGSMVSVRGTLERPVPARCLLELTEGEGEPRSFRYGTDHVPLAGMGGGARGDLVWVGFGIQSRKIQYDSLRGIDLSGKVAMLLEGDPRKGKNFEGPELTAEASIWNKLQALEAAGAAGAIVVRRGPERPEWMREDPTPPPLGYRYTWASWNPPTRDRLRGAGVPAIEVSLACAQALLGRDVAGLASKLDRGARPGKLTIKDRHVAFEAALEGGALTLPNVVGVLPGRDPLLAGEYVVVGAHMDHIGVGVRGRVGFGADDNASGTSALLEVVGALAAARPRRSVLFAVFSGEEDGLLGSQDLARNPPVSPGSIVAMVNLDMVGRGEASEVHCLGFEQNPGMEKVVHRAQDLGRTGIKRVRRCDDKGLFRRSDHYSFHQAQVPVVFFFENYPLEQNRDYHTWRDTFEGVDVDKVTHTARLAYFTAWLLAEDEERLPAPGG